MSEDEEHNPTRKECLLACLGIFSTLNRDNIDITIQIMRSTAWGYLDSRVETIIELLEYLNDHTASVWDLTIPQ